MMSVPLRWSLAVSVTLVLVLGCMCGGGEGTGATGGWPATITGACQSTFDCGCAEWSSVQSCVTSIGSDGVIEEFGGASCWVAQSCSQICGGGALACVNQAYARASATSAQMHEVTMSIINNTAGNPCNGGAVVRDARGNFVRCQ